MEASSSIPTPKTPRKQSTRDDRVRIEALYMHGDLTQEEIALRLKLTLRQVQYALAHRLTPQKHHRGRLILLNTPQRKRLVKWVTSSAANRRIKWKDIPAILG